MITVPIYVLIILEIIPVILFVFVWVIFKRNKRIKALKYQLQAELEGQKELISNKEKQLNESLSLIEELRLEMHEREVQYENLQSNLDNNVLRRTKDINALKELAEKNDQLKTAFLESISHEIRTPMNAILGFVNLIQNPALEENSREYYFNYINQSGKTLLGLIDDLIDFSKLETGKVFVEKSSCDLNKMLIELVREQRERVSREKPDITLVIDHSQVQLSIFTDCVKLKHVLLKLLDNAIKYTQKGVVSLSYEIMNNQVDFKIKDSGIGISEQDLRFIFDRFYQVADEQTKKFNGAGLGLAISKRYIELLGGNIWAVSKLGVGSEFCFSIPYEKVASDEQNSTKIKKTYNWLNKTILIAEDEDTNYFFLEAVLNKTRANILRASDGVELLEIFDSRSDIDILLLDIKMPGLNGYQAIKLIRQYNQSLPVIAQTAFNQSSDCEKCLSNGCNDYLSKPINKELLLKKIAEYLD